MRLLFLLERLSVLAALRDAIKSAKEGAVVTVTLQNYCAEDLRKLAKTINDVEISELKDGSEPNQKMFSLMKPLIGYEQYPFSYRRWRVYVVVVQPQNPQAA